MNTTTTGQRIILEILYYETLRTGGGWMPQECLAGFDGERLAFRDGVTLLVEWHDVAEEADLSSLELDAFILREDGSIRLSYAGMMYIKAEHEILAYDHAHIDVV